MNSAEIVAGARMLAVDRAPTDGWRGREREAYRTDRCVYRIRFAVENGSCRMGS